MTCGPTAGAAPGDVIGGKYKLESLLGEGGMGSVWRALNQQLEVPVALKLLRNDLAAADLRERLVMEARAAAQLTHPSIVRVFDIGEATSGDPFIVMELLVGESLGDILARGPIAPTTALSILLPIAEALSLAHGRGVVHRDLKPDNVFLAVEGSCLQPKLLDFGIAKISNVHAGKGIQTETGTLLGSPDYMSPEQAYGRSDIDERSDVWAFCVVLYEAIAGRTPFVGDSCQSTLRSVISDPTPPLASFVDVDPALVALIEAGLAKDRNARPASIAELARELASWLVAQGVREDVTGASIEAKWLGRARGLTPHDAARGPLALRSQQDEATLISVVHPLPRLASAPDVEVRAVHRRGSLATAAALVVMALAGYGLTRYQLGARRGSVAELDPTPAAVAAPALAPEPAPVRTVTTIPVVLIDAVAPAPPPRPAPRSFTKAPTQPATLPRALPERSRAADLLNPY